MFKKRAIKKYIQKLPTALCRRYGGGPPYSEGQVRTTVQDLKLSQKHIQCAYALFCEESTLEQLGFSQIQIGDIKRFLAVGFTTDSLIGGGDGFGGFGDGGGDG